MKINIAIITLIIVSSCSTEINGNKSGSNFNPLFPQEWELTFFGGQIANQQIELPYREFILLENDQTFKKTRIDGQDTLQAVGSFKKIALENNEEYFELTYSENNPLIENCSRNWIEYLFIREANLTGTANACDYPTKIYSLRK